MVEVRGELCGDLIGLHADSDVDARCTKLSDASARNVDVGVLDANDDTADTSFDDGFGTRTGSAGVCARLEGRGEDRTRSLRPCRVEGDDLGVGLARRFGGADICAAVGAADGAADPGVRRGQGPSIACSIDCQLHQFAVGHRHHCIFAACRVMFPTRP